MSAISDNLIMIIVMIVCPLCRGGTPAPAAGGSNQ